MHTFSLKAQLVNKKFNLSVTQEDNFIDYVQIKVQFCIEGLDVISFNSNANFFDLLEPVAQGESERYLLTCTCGVPECAGYEPFMLNRAGDALTIVIPDQRMYAPMNGLDYVIDAKEFEKAQAELIRYISAHTLKGAYLYEPYAENEIEVLEGEQKDFILNEPTHVDFAENFEVFKGLTQSPSVVFF